MIRQMAQSYKQKLWRRRMLVLHSGTSSTQYWDEVSKIKSQYMKLCTLTKIPTQWCFHHGIIHVFFLLVDQKYDNDSIHWFNDNSVDLVATRCVQYHKHQLHVEHRYNVQCRPGIKDTRLAQNPTNLQWHTTNKLYYLTNHICLSKQTFQGE